MNSSPTIYKWICYYDLTHNRIGWLGVLFYEYIPTKFIHKIIHLNTGRTCIHLKKC